MYFPNYKDGSIVNLMSSIGGAFRAKLPYAPLPLVTPLELAASTNIVLLIIDGLGYEQLIRYGKGSPLLAHVRAKITSVFPTTTAACITTFLTGVAPQQHGVTGWFMWAKEVGGIVTILRDEMRSKISYADNPRIIESLRVPTPFSQLINARSYFTASKDISRTTYTCALTKHMQRIEYASFPGLFTAIKKIIWSSSQRRSYLHAYWPELDKLCHHHGVGSRKVLAHFKDIEKRILKLAHDLEGTNTILLVTADHGLLDIPRSRCIDLGRDHPALYDMLSMPLSGDTRFNYYYVRPEKAAAFETYVRSRLAGVCQLYQSKDLLAQSLWGLGEPHERLHERIGDYVLIMKEDYIIKDFIVGEERKFLLATHGGVSKEEMFVPLVVIKT